MLQAVLVLPAFGLVYLVAAPNPLRKRIVQLLVATAALSSRSAGGSPSSSCSPASARPYVGGSQDNSVLSLIFGYNGFGRLTGNETGSVGGGGGNGGSMWGETGWLRLFNSEFGGQASWLLPAALVLLSAGLAVTWRAARTDRTRAALILWGGWLVVTGATFSLGQGIIHPYYTVALAPALGALVGIGGVVLWRRRHELTARIAVSVTIAVTAWWTLRLLDRIADVEHVAAAARRGDRRRRPRSACWPRRTWVAGCARPSSPRPSSVAWRRRPRRRSPLRRRRTTAPSRRPARSSTGGLAAGRRPPGGTPPSGGPGGFPGGTAAPPTGPDRSADRRRRRGRWHPAGERGQRRADRRPAGRRRLPPRGSPRRSVPTRLPATSWRARSRSWRSAASTAATRGRRSPPFQQYVAQRRDPLLHRRRPGRRPRRRSAGTASEITAWVAANFTATTIGGTTVYDLTT